MTAPEPPCTCGHDRHDGDAGHSPTSGDDPRELAPCYACPCPDYTPATS